jgi:hypothetical protein
VDLCRRGEGNINIKAGLCCFRENQMKEKKPGKTRKYKKKEGREEYVDNKLHSSSLRKLTSEQLSQKRQKEKKKSSKGASLSSNKREKWKLHFHKKKS